MCAFGRRPGVGGVFLSFESHDYAHAFEGCATPFRPAVRPERLRPVEIFVRNYGASSPVRVDFAFRGDLVNPAATEEFVEAFDSALDRLSDESHGGPRRARRNDGMAWTFGRRQRPQLCRVRPHSD